MKKEIALLGLLGSMLAGCQAMKGADSRGSELKQQQKSIYREKIDKAWALLDSGEAELSYKEFVDFNQKFPQTIYESETLLGQGTALSQMQEWSLASKVFHDLLGQRLGTHPQIAALAFYEQSKVSEALGNENDMLASLIDAEKHAGDLPEEIRIAALPARRGMAELKLGLKDEAQKSLAKAEQGILILRNRGASPQIWSQIYFEMGAMTTHQLSAENFQAHLDSYSRAQIFLLNAVESKAKPWASRALDAIQGHYRDFWNFATHPQVSASLDRGAQEREKAQVSRARLGKIGVLVSEMRKYQSPVAAPLSDEPALLNDFLTSLEAQTQEQLSQIDAEATLTLDSKKRNRLKKEGRVISEPLFSNEKKSFQSPPSVPAADPNLGK